MKQIILNTKRLNFNSLVKLRTVFIFFWFFQSILFLQASQSQSDVKLGGSGFIWEATIHENGQLEYKHLKSGQWKVVPFNSQGPVWYLKLGDEQHIIPLVGNGADFTGKLNDIQYTITYSASKEGLVIEAEIHNKSKLNFTPVSAGLKLGLDTYMDTYPQWMSKYFPTMLRCEKTHFWGYAMSPEGDILTIASPDSIASWSLDYEKGVFAHRIHTLNLDLINQGPLPERHPQFLNQIASGESKKWRIVLAPADNLNEVKQLVSGICNAPMADAENYTIEPGGNTSVKIDSPSKVSVNIETPNGKIEKISVKPVGKNLYGFNYSPTDSTGLYKVEIASVSGKKSEMILSLRHLWSWYIKQARKEVIDKPVRATPSVESIMGFYSLFLSRKYFPDEELDAKGEELYNEVFPLVYDFKKKMPTMSPDRIQGPACMAGMLTDRYEATHDINDLENAAALVDFLLTKQHPDGAYYSGKQHYTSVIYIAKSIMEVIAEEKKLADAGNIKWKEKYDCHFASVKAAINDLNKRKIDVGTEGAATFEDGMISCTAAQLAMFALLEPDTLLKNEYTNTALEVMNAHRCLTDLIIPDVRINGATKRFWEAWGSVRIKRNFLQSPHGWSAWRIYGLWYLYQLTGDEEWLNQTMNALGACTQLMDSKTGEMHWSFVTDPYVPTEIFVQDTTFVPKGKYIKEVLGESYINSVMGWYRGSTGRFIDEGDCLTAQGYVADEEHEIFKALEECALTSAYVVERENGQLISWNCKIQLSSNGEISVFPNEQVVDKVHVNLRKSHAVKTVNKNGKIQSVVYNGLKWIDLNH